MAHPSPSSPALDDKGSYRPYTGAVKQSFKNSTLEPKQQRSFWSVLAKKAKSALLDDGVSTCTTSDSELGQNKDCETLQPQILQYAHARSSAESKQRRSEVPVFQKRLEALTSSLSSLGGTIGNAIEEGFNMVETKATDFISSDSRLLFTKKTVDSSRSSQPRDPVSKSLQQQDSITKSSSQQQDSITNCSSQQQRDSVSKSLQQRQSVSKLLQQQDLVSEPLQIQRDLVVKPSQQRPSQQRDSGILNHAAVDKEIQLKASRDVAMAMAAKAKLLLRELKEAKIHLAIVKDRCAQLEEENKIIRESLSIGLKPDEEDLVRIQLETLLAEKARLAQENACYMRENLFLREVLEYHRLTMQGSGAFLEESILEVTEISSDLNIEETEDLPSETKNSTVSS